jgi:hypothetical protein
MPFGNVTGSEQAFSSAAMDIHVGESLECNNKQADNCVLISLSKEDVSQKLESFVYS